MTVTVNVLNESRVIEIMVEVHMYLRNEFDFFECSWNYEYFGSLAKYSGFTLTLQENQSIYDAMNIPKIEFIAYIYILL